MIAKDLRRTGCLLKLVKLNRPWQYRLLQKLIVAKGRNQLPDDSNIDVKTVFIPRRDGGKLRVRIYRRKHSNGRATGLLWLHGGGYAFGIPEIENGTIERFIQTADSVVISPDYRLSDEAPFPAALDDAYDTLLWLNQNVDQLGVRPNQLFVGGESAGGGLACATVAYARDLGEVAVAFQIPLYPMLDDRMATNSAQHNNAPVWNTKANITAWRQYLGDDFQTERVSAYAAPARLTNFQNLPPAFTFVGDIEPFYDETRLYFDNLKRAGVSAECLIFPGAFHGFDVLAPKSESAKKATKALMDAYLNATKNYVTPLN